MLGYLVGFAATVAVSCCLYCGARALEQWKTQRAIKQYIKGSDKRWGGGG